MTTVSYKTLGWDLLLVLGSLNISWPLCSVLWVWDDIFHNWIMGIKVFSGTYTLRYISLASSAFSYFFFPTLMWYKNAEYLQHCLSNCLNVLQPDLDQLYIYCLEFSWQSYLVTHLLIEVVTSSAYLINILSFVKSLPFWNHCYFVFLFFWACLVPPILCEQCVFATCCAWINLYLFSTIHMNWVLSLYF